MTVYILDALALAYRAHFAFINSPRMTSGGENTSAVFGFTIALMRLIKDYGIDHVVCVFDVVGKDAGTFRDELFDDYKAHREPPPEDLIANLPHIKEVLQGLGVPILEMQGFEADDVIATIAKQASAGGNEAVIVSPDKDFQQLLSDNVSMLKPSRKVGESFERVTVATFVERYGLQPPQFIDVQSLMGDKVDNVPGVTGIGEKTAVKLIQEYGDVETLLENAANVTGKRAREGLVREADNARMSKKLVTLVTDLDIPLNWEEAQRDEPDWPQLEATFTRLEFRTLLQRVRANQGGVSQTISAAAEITVPAFDETQYTVLKTHRELILWIGERVQAKRVAVETAMLPAGRTTSLVGIGMWAMEGQAGYIPLPMPDGTMTSVALSTLSPWLGSAEMLSRRAKEDLLALEAEGMQHRPNLFDTTVAHYLLAPEQRHDLDLLAETYLSASISVTPDETKVDQRSRPIDELAAEVTRRAHVIGKIVEPLLLDLKRHNLMEVAERIEFPLIPVLADMERSGVSLDLEVLQEIGAELKTLLFDLEGNIYNSAGRIFTIGSPQQLADVLYNQLGLPVKGKTGKGQPSTRESVLLELATEHELPGLILDWRRAAKLKSTYVDALGELVDPHSGRIHTKLNQTVTATGRLSSSNPNLQNIPVRREQGRQLRKVFIPQEGWRMLSADYVQIELRILASMSEDEALMAAFTGGRDIHSETAARLFGIAPEEVSRAQRSKAKEVNYGIPYGISAFGLAKRLRVPRSEADALIEAHRSLYPGVWSFLSAQVEKARESGFSETLLGRRRYLPRISARNRMERMAAERIAVNMPIQGSQADMIKLAMIRIHRELQERRLRARLLLQVHDELVFELPPEETDEVKKLVRDGMTEALALNVPVEVDLQVGPNWLEVH